MDDLAEQLEDLWLQLRPLYAELHAYVRRKLREQYGAGVVPADGPIPAHLFGNMWSQSWSNLYDTTAPYPDRPPIDVTLTMKVLALSIVSWYPSDC